MWVSVACGESGSSVEVVDAMCLSLSFYVSFRWFECCGYSRVLLADYLRIACHVCAFALTVADTNGFCCSLHLSDVFCDAPR